MGIPERREREKKDLRQKILKAARELLVKRGYEAVTMREIAKRIEYSATALYKHFADKEALVRELCREDFAAFARYFVEQVASSGDPLERFARSGLVYLGFAEQYPEHYRLMFMTELPPTPPEAGERDDPARNAYVFVRGLVDELMRGGHLRDDLTDVDLVAQTVWAGVHGAAALDLVVPKSKDWLDFRPRRERFACALEMVARSIAKDPEVFARVLRRALSRAEESGAAASRKGAE
ncbi:MAG TPA: TetR/AcrR family transcriptional regulator [Polyangiaceae bacterium]|nr:TetR/AcrR family transcriptional regulator [Polyangiaceae bacterium]